MHTYKTLFLRCSVEEQLQETLSTVNAYSAIYLGKISRPTGETTTELVDGEEVEVPVYEELDGYHANLLVCTCCMQDTIDAVSEVTIEQPNNPAEVFA